jgi:hypothetical protein
VLVVGGAIWMPEVHASDARFSFGLSAFALGACGEAVRRGPADLALCGALWAGALHAVVSALTPLTPGDRPWVGVEGAPRLRIRLWGRLHAELSIHFIVPLVRPPFTVVGLPAPVFQQAPVTALGLAGLGASFP